MYAVEDKVFRVRIIIKKTDMHEEKVMITY